MFLVTGKVRKRQQMNNNICMDLVHKYCREWKANNRRVRNILPREATPRKVCEATHKPWSNVVTSYSILQLPLRFIRVPDTKFSFDIRLPVTPDPNYHHTCGQIHRVLAGWAPCLDSWLLKFLQLHGLSCRLQKT